MFPAIVLFSITSGTSVTYERTRPDGTSYTVVERCEGGNSRIDTVTAQGERTVIWDAAAKALLVLRKTEKTYSKVTEAMLAELKQQKAARLAQLKEKLASMPPAERARAEAMIAEPPPGEWRFTATGKKTKVGKFDCELYDAQRDDNVKAQVCLAPWASGPAKKEDIECFNVLSKLFASISRGMADGAEAGPEGFTAFPGYAVQIVRDVGEGKKVITTVTGVERGVKVPPEVFSVPADYKLVEAR